MNARPICDRHSEPDLLQKIHLRKPLREKPISSY
jgi:hypothetical protein